MHGQEHCCFKWGLWNDKVMYDLCTFGKLKLIWCGRRLKTLKDLNLLLYFIYGSYEMKGTESHYTPNCVRICTYAQYILSTSLFRVICSVYVLYICFVLYHVCNFGKISTIFVKLNEQRSRSHLRSAKQVISLKKTREIHLY